MIPTSNESERPEEPKVKEVMKELYQDGLAQEWALFDLTQDQELAVKAVMGWYGNRRSEKGWRPYFILAGAAGTGKSSLIQYLVANLNLRKEDVLCCAFTGKAALNMRRKGNKTSETLHSSIYDCKKTAEGFEFHLKSHLYHRLIIVDEASMISKELFDDIMSFNIPVIFIGDHCQLPPIDGSFNIMLHPDFTLRTIVRQAEKSPIIRASQLAIKGKPIPFCSFDGFRKIREADLTEEDLTWADQIVCGFNATRHALNKTYREITGKKGAFPEYGERMVVLNNNRKYNVFNGQIVYIASTPSYDYKEKTWTSSYMDELEHETSIHAVARKDRSFEFKLGAPPEGSAGKIV
ncbi:MAG: AAA family ATPase, partial [Clostridia bacterium]|nr:AAA family ATPase [Clostridia bacterium]